MRRIATVFVMVALLLAGCGGKAATEQKEVNTTMKLTANMPTVLFIIAQKDFRDEELSVPKQILENAGVNVKVASITTDTATGSLGARVKPDLAVKDAKIEDYDMVVVVGGPGSPALMNHTEVLELLQAARQANKSIAGICLGPMTLAKSGVLGGKRATVFETPESRNVFEEGNAIFVRQSVVVDGNTVTADGPAAAKAFGNELLKLIK